MTLPDPSPSVNRQPLEMMAEQTRLLTEINTQLLSLHEGQEATQDKLIGIQRQINTMLKTGRPVELARLDIPFMNIVNFMVKWALASIPAAIMLTVIGVGVFLLLSALLAIFGISNNILH